VSLNSRHVIEAEFAPRAEDSEQVQ